MLLGGLIIAVAGASSLGTTIIANLAGAAGLTIVHERLRATFSPAVAFVTSVLLFGATSLFLFATSAPSPAVTGSFAAVAIVMALATLIMQSPARLLKLAAAGAVVAATALAGYLAAGGANPSPALSWTDALFSSSHGFLAWTPVAYIAVAGTLAYAIRDRLWALTAIGALVLLAGVSATWGARPFGGTLVPSLAVLAPGLAFVVDRVRARPIFAVLPLVLGALLWNYLLMVQYTVGLLPKDEPISFAAMVRQQAEVHTQGAYIYPFAFPMNAWFALVENLPIDRYDLLAREPLRTALDLTLDRRADRFLLEGWDAPGADDAGPSWWIGDPRATIALPVDPPRDRGAVISVLARTRYEEPVVEADVGVEVNGYEVGGFVAAATAPSEATIILAPEVVRRTLRPGYNRLTFVSRGVRRVDPSDTRPPGPIAARGDSRAWPVTIYRIRFQPASR